MASPLALQCFTNWAMKTHKLGVGQIVEFSLTRERNEAQNEDVVKVPDCPVYRYAPIGVID